MNIAKNLEWPNEIRRGQRNVSSGGTIDYTIAYYGGSSPDSGVVYRWAIEGGGWSEAFFAYEHAIAAAQADYESRIRNSISTSALAAIEEREEMVKALKRLYRGYVNSLENGRDRIMSLGGDCDPVDVMEAGNPDLIEARALLSRIGEERT